MCLQKGIPFPLVALDKINLDDASGYLPYLGDLDSNVKIVYLSPNIIPLIQPVDQGCYSNI